MCDVQVCRVSCCCAAMLLLPCRSGVAVYAAVQSLLLLRLHRVQLCSGRAACRPMACMSLACTLATVHQGSAEASQGCSPGALALGIFVVQASALRSGRPGVEVRAYVCACVDRWEVEACVCLGPGVGDNLVYHGQILGCVSTAFAFVVCAECWLLLLAGSYMQTAAMRAGGLL